MFFIYMTKTEQLGVEEFLPEKDELKYNIRAYLLSHKGLRGSAAPVVLCEAGGGSTDRQTERQTVWRQTVSSVLQMPSIDQRQPET
ncbi:unnamed protein product [Arctogadus glacialis]